MVALQESRLMGSVHIADCEKLVTIVNATENQAWHKSKGKMEGQTNKGSAKQAGTQASHFKFWTSSPRAQRLRGRSLVAHNLRRFVCSYQPLLKNRAGKMAATLAGVQPCDEVLVCVSKKISYVLTLMRRRIANRRAKPRCPGAASGP